MDLVTYLAKNRIRNFYFAQILGISRVYFQELLSGKRKFGTELAKKIVCITGGEVSYFSLTGVRQSRKKTSLKPKSKKTSKTKQLDAFKDL